MKSILIISQILPLKSHNGGSTQIRNLIKALKRNGYLTDFVSFNIPKSDDSSLEEVKIFLNQYTQRYFIIPFNSSYKPNLFSCEGVVSYYSSKMNKILKMLSNQHYSAIFAEFISMGHYIKNFSGVPKIINIHELNFLRQFREGKLNYTKRDKLYLIFDSIKSALQEIRLLKEADIILSYNQFEVELIKIFIKNKGVHHIPLTIEIPEKRINPDEREFDFVFLGNYEHKPNRDAAQFILDNIKSVIGGKKLLIGGRNINLLRYTNNQQNNIILTANIDEPHKFLQKGRILIAPIFTGGGARVKIVEGMANENLIITTDIGAEGLTDEEKRGMFIFSKEDFLNGKAITIAENYNRYLNLLHQNILNVESYHNIDASLRVRELYIRG
ncbi:MAG: glycosyltransferase [Myxococcota bacterium]